jgi:hypothetical protein
MTTNVITDATQDYDMVRISSAKKTVDLAPNTIRRYASQGLRLYKLGKASFFSKSELAAFIRQNGN